MRLEDGLITTSRTFTAALLARDNRDPEDQYGAAGSGQHDRPRTIHKAEVWSPCSCGKWRLSWKMCGRLRSIKMRVFHFRHFQ
jgi:hypothetical protein